jgi:hypothetical protein
MVEQAQSLCARQIASELLADLTLERRDDYRRVFAGRRVPHGHGRRQISA